MLKLVDSNVWLALTLSAHGLHGTARTWFDRLRGEDQAVFCRATAQTLLRLLTTAEVLAPYGIAPLSNAEAWAIYTGWLASESVSFADEPRELDAHWKTWAARKAPAPKLWMDAYLAAFAVAGSYQLVTMDQAFRQFKGLDLQVLQPTKP
jgi:toxin-antitoxin system PIN domain toxin